MKPAISIREAVERQLRLIETSHLRLEASYTLLDESNNVLSSASRLMEAHFKDKMPLKRQTEFSAVSSLRLVGTSITTLDPLTGTCLPNDCLRRSMPS